MLKIRVGKTRILNVKMQFFFSESQCKFESQPEFTLWIVNMYIGVNNEESCMFWWYFFVYIWGKILGCACWFLILSISLCHCSSFVLESLLFRHFIYIWDMSCYLASNATIYIGTFSHSPTQSILSLKPK